LKILAITSGKGGVGKTTVTLNIARQLSLAGLRTLIIDFDIHNKGTTCLFMDKVSHSEVQSILGVMRTCSRCEEGTGRSAWENFGILDLGYDGKLFLVPAARPDEMVEWETFVCDTQTIVNYLGAFVRTVAQAHEIDAVLIDCYGGVDTLTISAAGIANDLIIINEPDVITFAGTLLLYKQLENVYGKSERIPRVHFVINRISGRHSFRFLREEYRLHLAELAVDRSVLAYLPYDKLVFDTFGDYPFFSELLPKGLYAKKICELIARLWPEPEFLRMTSRSGRRREHIYEATAENAFADPERIFQVWKTAPVWTLLPITALLLLYEGPNVESISFFALRTTFYMSLVFFSAVVLVGVLFEPYQVTRWLLRKANYDSHKRRLLFGDSPRNRFRSLSDYAMSCIPAALGLLCLTAVLVVAKGQRYLYPFRNVSIWRKQIHGFYPKEDLRDLRLANGVTIASWTDLSHSKLDRAQLIGTLFPRVDLTEVSFADAKLEHANLMGDTLNGATLSDIPNMNFVNLSASVAKKANFSNTYLISTQFWASDLSDANFEGAVLYMTDFRQSRLNGAKFAKAIIKDTLFDGADLTDADLSEADFSYMNIDERATLFSQLEHQGARLSGIQKMLAVLGAREDEDSWWLNWEKLQPVHRKDIEKRINDLGKRLSNPKAARKGNSDDETPRLSDTDLGNLLKITDDDLTGDPKSPTRNPGVFATKSDLMELLLVQGTEADLKVVHGALQNPVLSQEDAALQCNLRKSSTTSEDYCYHVGVALVLRMLHSIIVKNRMEEARNLAAWKRWLEVKPNHQLDGWSWDMWDENFPALRYSQDQITKIRAIHLSAIHELTAAQMMHWFSAPPAAGK
jgi:cellulose biosynthesis protein BcsQ/uncharacterized protein YjbI with pentapeptide repeats